MSTESRPAAPDDATQDALPRRIGLWSMVAITMGVVIGSGIFRSPSSIAQIMGSVSGVALVWLVGGIVTLCLALCLAELATMFPRAGGIYVYLHEAYGRPAAFIFGWTFLLINPAQWAALALIFAEYLGYFIDLSPNGRRAVAAGLIALVCASNYFSVRLAAAIQNVSTLAKVIALAAIALILFVLGSPDHGATTRPWTQSPAGITQFGVAVVAVLWPYEGVASACAIAGEVRNPAYALPRALLLSVVGVTLLYLAVNLAYLYVLPLDAVATSGYVAADAMQTVAGSTGAAFISACVLVSTFGAISATATLDPRVFYAMARDGMFFEKIGHVHPRHRTPHVAIVTSGMLAVIYVCVRTFEELAAQFIVGLWVFYGLAAAALFVLRAKQPDVPRPYRVIGYPVVPTIFLLGGAGLLVSALIELPAVTLVNLGVMSAGLPLYFIWRSFNNKRQSRERPAER